MSARRTTTSKPAPKGRAPKGRTPKRPWSVKRVLGAAALWTAILGLLGFIAGVGAFAYLYNTIDIPDPNSDFQTETTTVYYADGKTPIGTFAIQNREWMALEDMPPVIRDAVVAAENRTFWTDKGIDPRGIIRAAFSNASGGQVQGASTITQQYVKLLYLSNERSITRKVKEAIISIKLQRTTSKNEILEGYLNTVYFGRGAYGVQAASKAFFGHPAQELNLREAAVLAAILNRPNGSMDPANGREAKDELKERFNYVLTSMAEVDAITEEEAEANLDRLPKFPKIEVDDRYGGQTGHVLALVRKELDALGFTGDQIDGGGLKIVTTITPEAMEAAAGGVLAQRPEGFKDKQLHIGVASVEVGTGGLLGFYGGQDFLDSQINWAATGGMAGSTMKPFTVAAAIESGFSLKDTFQGNSPYEFPDGLRVRNEGAGPDGLGNDYGERVNMIKGMEQSINTVFIDMSASMGDGPSKILDMALRLGLPPIEASKKYPGIPSTTPDLGPDALNTLGKARVSPINMANAYATIANSGLRAEVHVVDSVENRFGETLYEFNAPVEPALDADIAADVSFTMQGVVKTGTGRAALGLGRPAAGKTGTATKEDGLGGDYVSSAWFVGFTPQVSTAVMYIRGDGDDKIDDWLPEYFGGSYPARTWTDVMGRLMIDMPVESFPPPVYVDGDAPVSGHEPTPSKPTTSATPTETTTPTDTGSPTTSPTTSPSGSGTPSGTPTTTPPTTPPTTPAPLQRPRPRG